MTISVKDVQKRLRDIAAAADDPETAHGLEDDLYADILRAIADGSIIDARECARLALTSNDIEFSRWCA